MFSWQKPTTIQEQEKKSPVHGSKWTKTSVDVDMDTTPPAGPKPLPSSDSARDLVEKKPGAIGRVVGHAAGRACLIGLGVYAAGERDVGTLARAAIGGSLMIELFAVGWFKYQKVKSE